MHPDQVLIIVMIEVWVLDSYLEFKIKFKKSHVRKAIKIFLKEECQ